jgi:hypothetical protein
MGELFVAGHCPARFFTRPAELGACTARDHVIGRTPQHEVGAGVANLGAVEQYADEVDLGVIAAGRQAVLERHRAYGVTVEALLGALLQVVVRLFVGMFVQLDITAPAILRHVRLP